MKKFAFAIAALALVPSSAALAIPAVPTPPDTFKVIPITFTGVVANDVTQEIKVRQPNGTYVPYTGPVPDYPYKKGDPITVSFNAVVPTAKTFGLVPYSGQLAADGTYRFNLSYDGGFQDKLGAVGGRFQQFNQPTVSLPGVDVSGQIGKAGGITEFGQAGDTRLSPVVFMALVYDSKADTYSIDFSNNKNFGAAAFNTMPGYVLDAATGALTPCAGTTGNSCVRQVDPLSRPYAYEPTLRGNATDLSMTSQIYDTLVGPNAGFFSLLFSGSWNLPSFGSGGSSGGPTDVPEPSMMLLFGGGTAALLRKRRRKAGAAGSATIREYVA